MNLVEFINSSIKNQHVEHPEFSTLYVRKSNRYVRGVWHKHVFDIASLSATEPGKGAFGRLLEEICSLWDGPIYMECVQYDRFAQHLRKRRFTLADGPDCFILLR